MPAVYDGGMSTLFAAVYDRLMAPLERGRFRAIRTALLTHAVGHVLEIGAGTGINFPLYPAAVTQVDALEPDPAMSARAAARQACARVPLRRIAARAEALPYPDASVDTVVATLVLCTVGDPHLSLREAHRVLKPGGRLLVFEHVRLANPLLAALQTALTPLWRHVAGGCHLDRDTLRLVREAGFETVNELPESRLLFRVALATRIS